MSMDKKIKKKKWTVKRISIYAFGMLFISFLLWSFLFADKRSKVKIDQDKITVGTVEYGVFQDFIPVTGNVLPIETRFLDAIEGGIIQSIDKESGEILKTGDVILKLTNTALELSVLSQEASLYEQINRSATTRLSLNQNDLSQQAQLAEIQYQIELLNPQYDRYKTLFEKNLISKREFEEVEEQYKYYQKKKELTYASYRQDSLARSYQLNQINASARRMLQSLDGVSRILENLIIRAPIDGQLATPDLELGQSIVSGDRIGQIDVLDSFKVRVRIDELYLPRTEKGLFGTFNFDREQYELVITKIYPTIAEGRFEVDMEFTGEQAPGIKRGQSVRIRLQLGNSAEALLLPVGGFYKDTGGNWVYVVEENGAQAVRRDIRLGRKNPEYFEVTSGLKEGDRVITSSYDHFGDNEVLLLK
jgi:HlyD family secretion protein